MEVTLKFKSDNDKELFKYALEEVGISTEKQLYELLDLHLILEINGVARRPSSIWNRTMAEEFLNASVSYMT